MIAIRRPRRLAAATAAALAAAATALALGLASAGPAAAAPRADTLTPEQAAAQMCQAAQAGMGSMFSTLVGTMEQCQVKALAIVNAAVAKCGTGADASSCVQAAVQSGVMELASGSIGAGGAANAAITEQALSQACTQLKAQMGAQRYAKEFGSDAGCRTRMKPEVDAIIASASAACNGKADPSSCIATQAAAAEQSLVAKYGGGPSADTVAAEIAAEVCARLQAELGDRFAKKYGSAEKCQGQIAAKAAPIASAASTKCKAAADKEACITEEINAQTDALSQSLGAGPTVSDITDEIADNACTRLKTELGARFAQKFGSDAGCRTKVAQASASFAGVALAACTKAGDKASCIASQVSAGTAQLQGVLGSGPSATELAAEIADQACPQLLADNPDAFNRAFGSLPVCRTRMSAQIPATDLKAALDRCKAAADRDACIQQAALDMSGRLTDQLGGPSIEDIVFDAAGTACEQLDQQMGHEEYRKRFVSLRYCRERITNDVRAAVTPAWAKCKTAKDRQACTTSATQGAIEKATAAYTGPSTTEVGGRLATEACNAARKELGAEEFEAQLKGQEPCLLAIGPVARSTAATVLNACAATPAAGRAACVTTRIAAAVPDVEKALRALADVPRATVTSVTAQYVAQLCQRAKEELGSWYDSQIGGDAGCRGLLGAEAQRVVALSLDVCGKGKDQACMTRQLDGNASVIQKRFFPVTADPTYAQVVSGIASTACDYGKSAAAKAGLSAAFDKRFNTPTTSSQVNCTRFFSYAAGTPASQIAPACSAKRPVDVRVDCFRSEMEKAARALQGAIEQTVKGAAGKR